MSRRLSPTLVVGAVLVGLVIVTAVVSTVWTPTDPTHVEVSARLRGPEPRYVLVCFPALIALGAHFFARQPDPQKHTL